MSHVDRMSEREKNRTRGAYFLIVDRDPDRAIEALSKLVEEFPADNAGLANLAVAYQLRRDFPRALEEGRKAIAIYPKNVPQRNNVGLFATYAGDFETAIREQKAVLAANPSFVNGAVGLALAQEAAGRRDDALATWQGLQKGDADAVSAATEGLADLALAEGRIDDAQGLLERGIKEDRATGSTDAAARKLVMLAGAHLASGNPARAMSAAEQARKIAVGEAVRFGLARVLLEAGDEKGAAALADELDSKLATEPRMYAAVIRGAIDVRHRRYPSAIGHLKAALGRVDAWLARAALGRAYLAAGAFTEAHQELERCVQRRGEATDIFLDVIPTWRAFPMVQLDLARALEGLKSDAAPEAYRAFLAQRRGAADPLAAEVRRRLGIQ
jgi:eukaryotic-like serine/threonine-protein kinase